MINYYKSAYGLKLLRRVGGSCVYRSFIPGLASVAVVFLLRKVWAEYDPNFADSELEHPYAIGVLVTSLSLLLIFRVQTSFARYWEAAGSVHQFLSRMLDSASHTACYHMQCSHYDHIKPPSYFDYPELNRFNLSRARERFRHNEAEASHRRLQRRATGKSIEQVKKSRAMTTNWKLNRSSSQRRTSSGTAMKNGSEAERTMHASSSGAPIPFEGPARLDGNFGNLFDDGKATFFDPNNPSRIDACGFAGVQGGRTPPLFLQELAHLTSLTTAVALSTLRNDIEGAESPLDIYQPGAPWPDVDSHFWEDYGFTAYQKIKFFLGNARSPEERTKYNASRPLLVLGGVSEGEIRFLQQARGPYAKTELCWTWLSEFITREHLAGSLGKVGPPIISRVMQFLGDAMVMYNHGRKIMFIPFPFPHAQLSALYVLIAIPSVALLFEQYCQALWLACLLAFWTMTCLAGIHEVARELENPFRNIPNDLPLATMQAQFNEALIT